jgi:hypothetical protein
MNIIDFVYELQKAEEQITIKIVVVVVRFFYNVFCSLGLKGSEE